MFEPDSDLMGDLFSPQNNSPWATYHLKCVESIVARTYQGTIDYLYITMKAGYYEDWMNTSRRSISYDDGLREWTTRLGLRRRRRYCFYGRSDYYRAQNRRKKREKEKEQEKKTKRKS
jgi:hypothetical protein